MAPLNTTDAPCRGLLAVRLTRRRHTPQHPPRLHTRRDAPQHTNNISEKITSNEKKKMLSKILDQMLHDNLPDGLEKKNVYINMCAKLCNERRLPSVIISRLRTCSFN